MRRMRDKERRLGAFKQKMLDNDRDQPVRPGELA